VVTLQREAQTGLGPGLSATWYCDAPRSMNVIFAWGGLPGGETITFYFTWLRRVVSIGPYSGSSGSVSAPTRGSTVDSGYAVTSGGVNIPLPGALTCT
jgi:hypothetical protein